MWNAGYKRWEGDETRTTLSCDAWEMQCMCAYLFSNNDKTKRGMLNNLMLNDIYQVEDACKSPVTYINYHACV